LNHADGITKAHTIIYQNRENAVADACWRLLNADKTACDDC